MKKNFPVQFTIILLLGIFIAGCCNCGSVAEKNSVKGTIVIVGNEPFTKLALRMDNDKIVILDCPADLKKELWKAQGSYYSVLYSDVKVDEGTAVLKVEKAISINKDSK